MPVLDDYRAQHPEYAKVPDRVLADALYRKNYADKMPRGEFDRRVMGFSLGADMPAVDPGQDTINTMLAAPGGFTGNAVGNVEPAKPITGVRRALTLADQGMGRGLADLAGLPSDLGTAALNAGAWFSNVMRPEEVYGDWSAKAMPTPYTRLPGGSEDIKRIGTNAALSLGFQPIAPADQSQKEQTIGGLQEAATAFMVPGLGLDAAGANLPRALRGLAKPYADARRAAIVYPDAPRQALALARPHLTNMAMAGGAEMAPEAEHKIADRFGLKEPGPVADMIASTLGALGGAAGYRIASGFGNLGKNAALAAKDKLVGAPEIGGKEESRRVQGRAADIWQGAGRGDRLELSKEIQDAIARNRADGVPADAMPTTGLLTEDAGLIGFDKQQRLRDPAEFLDRDRTVQGYAAREVGKLVPEGADTANIDTEVRRLIDNDRVAAEDAVAGAKQDLADTQVGNELHVADVQGARDNALMGADRAIADANIAKQDARGAGEQRANDLEFERAQALANADAGIAAKGDEAGKAAADLQAVGEGVRANRAIGADASKRVDEVVGQTRDEMQGYRGALLENIDPKGDVQIPLQPFKGLGDAIKEEADRGLLRRAPHDVIARIEQKMQVRDAEGKTVVDDQGKPVLDKNATVSFRDLNSWRMDLASAEEAARRMPDNKGVGLERAYRQFRDQISQVAKDRAAAGDKAAQDWMDYEVQHYAPTFRQGEAMALDRDLRADPFRNDTPPAETAGRFLQPGVTGEAPAASLAAILDKAPNRDAGVKAARDYVMADLAKQVPDNGPLTPDRMGRWFDQWTPALDKLPELKDEFQKLRADLTAKAGSVGTTKAQLEQMTRERGSLETDYKQRIDAIRADARKTDIQKAKDIAKLTGDRSELAINFEREIATIRADGKLTETQKQARVDEAINAHAATTREIQNSALSLVVGADPKVAVGKIFGSDNPRKNMREMVQRLGDNEAAGAGWKRAVAEYVNDEVTNTWRAATEGGLRPVSNAKLENMLHQHDDVLGEVFDNNEMHAMQTVRRLMYDQSKLTLQASRGSPTTENSFLAEIMQPTEIGLKAWFGQLKGGGIMRSFKLLRQYLPGYGTDEAAAKLARKALFDPEVAVQLLNIPREPKDIDRFSRRMAILMGADQAGRSTANDPKPSEALGASKLKK